MRAFKSISALALLVLAISLPSSLAQPQDDGVVLLQNGTSLPDTLQEFPSFADAFNPDVEDNNDFPAQDFADELPPSRDYDDDFLPEEPLPPARPARPSRFRPSRRPASRRPSARRPASRRPSRRNRNGTAGPVFVIGSAITSSTENFGRIKSGFSRRSKRQASTLPVSSPRRPRFLTDTQRRFAFLNDNFPEALRMQLSRLVQQDPDLRRDIKVDRRGVTCNDVCTSNSVGFGLIGFCSNVYCICDTREEEPELDDEEPEFGSDRDLNGGRTRRHQIARCPLDQVFDPNRFTCDHPAETDMCSDDPPDNPNPPKDEDDFQKPSSGLKPKRKPSKRTKVVYVGWEAPTTRTEWAPSTVVHHIRSSYGAPAAWSQSQPQPVYGVPAPVYGAPAAAPVLRSVQQQYGAPVQQLQSYSAPQQQYGVPVQQVQQQYAAPVQQIQGYATAQQYGAPTPVYKAPAPLSLDGYLNAAVESHQSKTSGQIVSELNPNNNGQSQHDLPILTQKKRSS